MPIYMKYGDLAVAADPARDEGHRGYLTVELEDIIVSYVYGDGAAGSGPMESVSFAFGAYGDQPAQSAADKLEDILVSHVYGKPGVADHFEVPTTKITLCHEGFEIQ